MPYYMFFNWVLHTNCTISTALLPLLPLYIILYYYYILTILPLLLLLLLQYNPIDAGYPASDEAMRIAAKLPQCAWISVTNGDNAYGFAVVDKVLSEAARARPDMILLPMDSRNFALQGIYYTISTIYNYYITTFLCIQQLSITTTSTVATIINSNISLFFLSYFYYKAYKLAWEARGKFTPSWDDYCVDFEMRKPVEYPYGFAQVSHPYLGGVDVAAIFIDRKKFLKTGKMFGEFFCCWYFCFVVYI